MERLNNLIFDTDSDDEGEELTPVLEIHRLEPISRWGKERIHLFERYDDHEFAVRYRLSKETAMDILMKIEHNLEYISDRNSSISPINQLLGTLRFYATNATQIGIAKICGWSAPTANKIIHKVSAAIASMHKEYIHLPDTSQKIQRTQENFYQIAQFPKVIGALGCTHIRLSFVPLRCQIGGEEAELFKNEKGYYSINVQIVCNADLEITDIVARWPGSCYNNTILNNSVIKVKFEDGHYNDAVLLADDNYTTASYIMPPVKNPKTPAEKLYNASHIKTRNPIEKCFWLWKRRFPILALGMRVKLHKALTIIVATAVLHNVLLRKGESLPPDDAEIVLPAPWETIISDGQIPGIHLAREALVANYFNSLG